MQPNALLYFVKYPIAGRVKTRLAKTVGDQKAAKMYKELAEKNYQEIKSLNSKGRCDYVVVFDPPDRMEDFKKWLKGPCRYWPQCDGSLSARLIHAFSDAFQSGAKRVMVLGSDTLDLSAEIIQEGFDALMMKDIVVGPAQDGGYYLIGSNHFYPALFEAINWSTDQVFTQTMEIIRKLDLSYHLLQTLKDLDE